MDKLIFYYDFLEFNRKFYLVAVLKTGLAFISSEMNQFYEFYSFYPHQMLVQNRSVTDPYLKELKSLLLGQTKKFELPIDISHFGQPEQHEIWKTIQKIPYGKRMSSQNIVTGLNNKYSIRAVENAVLLNPVIFVIPTHRVILLRSKKSSYRCGETMLQYMLDLEKENFGN